MKLIVDSGSTKTDWCLISAVDDPIYFKTEGINPIYVGREEISKLVREQVIPRTDGQVEEVHFFGAGCNYPARKEVVLDSIGSHFPHSEVFVESDLMGACLALFGNEAGIGGILGTGAGSCLFDGRLVQEIVPGLGYAMGDEGSGAYLGKQLISSFFRKKMPKDLKEVYPQEYQSEDIIKTIYSNRYPSRVLASMTLFLSTHKAHPFVQDLVTQAFIKFCEAFVLPYRDYRSHQVGVVGSIAYHFSDMLQVAARETGLEEIRIVQSPIHELVGYFQEKVTSG